jgi:hypothetical protein
LLRSERARNPAENPRERARTYHMGETMENPREWTGGCQCGAVRYRLRTPPEHASICHCRMCQRASGQPFMALARVRDDALQWTRGRPSTYASSNIVERGFCGACGTPLTYHRLRSGKISITIGSLDDPESACPAEQFGIESRLSWSPGLAGLPSKRTEDWMRENAIDRIERRQYVAPRTGSQE